MTKSLLAAVLILFALMFASVAFATGGHVPVIVKPPVVVAPPPAPPVVASPAAAAPVAPAQQPVAGNGPGAMGWAVMGGVVLYFYAVICTKERSDNKEGWFAQNCKPSWME